MSRRARSKKSRVAISVGVMAILAAVVYLTRPQPDSPSLTTSDPPREAAAGTQAPGVPADKAPEKIEPESPASDAGAPIAQGGHGADAVVRAGEEIQAPARVARPMRAPDWSSPVDLGFRDFKALRRQFRQNKDFDPAQVARLHGAAVLARGALMPIDPVPRSGELERFWLANPVVVMAGCVFCNPPTMGDLVYVRTNGKPLKVDRERLYRSVVSAKLLGRFQLGPGKSEDGVEYMFSMDLQERKE